MAAADVGLTGTKLGCGEGGCGACTVMVSSVGDDGQLLHRSVNACLCPLYAIEGMHVVTVEGAPAPTGCIAIEVGRSDSCGVEGIARGPCQVLDWGRWPWSQSVGQVAQP